jgi:molybdopterin-containing oxidoreductase family iron-sulfur binding subunit
MRYGMVIDLKKCIGCMSCQMACKTEKGTPPGIFYRRVFETEVGQYPLAKRMFLPIQCMQCRVPICKEVCPTGATVQREDGIITIDKEKCMGCKYCIVACPYPSRMSVKEIRPYYGNKFTPYEQVRYADHRVGTAEKCDFCLPRLEEGLKPACVQTCPTNALYIGNLDDPNSEVSQLIRARSGYQLKPEYGTDPCVYYLS